MPNFPPTTRYLRHGFPGQRMFVLPASLVEACLRDRSAIGFVPTDVGYFPDAWRHLVRRASGIDQLIVIYCTAGTGWADVAGKRHPVTPGQVLLIGSGLPHAYGASDDQPWTIHWMHLSGPVCSTFQEALINAPCTPILPVGRDRPLEHMFDKLFNLMCRCSDRPSLLQPSLASGAIIERLCEARRAQRSDDGPGDRMAQAVGLMWHRINGQVTLVELAEAASLSTSHFAACFKQRMGSSPLDYFHGLKMQQAAHLLDDTSLPVKSVAARLGYMDPLYFSRRFRHHHGISPVQYRAGRGRLVSAPG